MLCWLTTCHPCAANMLHTRQWRPEVAGGAEQATRKNRSAFNSLNFTVT
jgi:hypothetical protein